MADSVNLKVAADNTKERDFKALPMGRYNLLLEEAEVVPDRNNNPMIKSQFTVLDEGPYHNRKLWHNFTLGDKALPILVSFLRKANLGSLLLTENIKYEELAFKMEGAMVSAYTEPGETPKGNPKNELKAWQECDPDVRAKSEKKKSSDEPDFLDEETSDLPF